MKIFLYDHSGCYNRGCEAIVRSTVTMLRKYLPDAYFGLCSYNIDTDSALEGFVDELIDGSFAPLGFAQSAINAFNAKLFGNFDYYYKN